MEPLVQREEKDPNQVLAINKENWLFGPTPPFSWWQLTPQVANLPTPVDGDPRKGAAFFIL